VTIRPGSLPRSRRPSAQARSADLGRSLAYAAALRVARFGNANEHADRETAHHVFTYTNAVHQMLKRIGTAKIDGYVTSIRCVLHGAMALHPARYLNVPPARIPGEAGSTTCLSTRRQSAPPCSMPLTGSDRSISQQS
jgi:hypothetical protein